MYLNRISKIREYLKENNLSGIFIAPDANWEYVANVPRLSVGNTKQRQNSSQFTSLLITRDHAIAFMSKLHHIVTTTKLIGKECFAELVYFPDGDIFGTTFYDFINKLGLKNSNVGICEDVSSAIPLFLAKNFNINCIDSSQILTDMRSIKCEQEIEIMHEAHKITDLVFHDLLSMLVVGAKTREIEIEVDKLIEKHGGQRTSFPTDLNVHGENSGPMVGCSHETIEKGYVLGLDFGLMHKGYCTDVGRTVFIGEPTKRHVEILNTVLNSQEQGILALSKKCCGQDVHLATMEVMKQANLHTHYIHKAGHGIGLDVHEKPFLALGQLSPVQEGMVFAIEPSVFIEKDCFIRVEDDILITKDGIEQLSTLTKEMIIIE